MSTPIHTAHTLGRRWPTLLAIGSAALDKVVARSYAEWCGAVDVLMAVQLVALA